MGRPRKQPRRVMTFNINETTAQRIDNLNLSNRSEWANKALTDIMDDRLATTKGHHLEELKKAKKTAAEDAENALITELSDNPHRLATMLFSSLQRAGFDQTKIKGRYTLSEQLLKAINDGTFRGE